MFLKRLMSSIVLVLIALLALVMGGPILAFVLAIVSTIAYLELTKALKVHTESKRNSLEIVGVLGALTYYIYLYFFQNLLYLLFVMVLVFMFSMLLYVVKFPKYETSQVLSSFSAFIYAPVMLSFIYMTRATENGSALVWLILISSWGCDTCAYIVGMLFGKKKIFPVLSPKKSLEGCIGGVIGSAILGGVYSYFVLVKTTGSQEIIYWVAFICAVGAVMSQIGDLAASAIKRQHNIKDYGKLIPGHGGIMDRFDSVIVTAPMIYFLTVLLIQQFS